MNPSTSPWISIHRTYDGREFITIAIPWYPRVRAYEFRDGEWANIHGHEFKLIMQATVGKTGRIWTESLTYSGVVVGYE